MNRGKIRQDKTGMSIESFVLMAGLLSLLSLLASLLLGPEALWLGPVSLLVFSMIQSGASVMWLVRAQGGVPVPEYHPVADIFHRLCRRAGLHRPVRLFYLNSNKCNAFTIGHGDNSVIVLNRPILEYFSNPEVAAILAHELSHVLNKDTRFMAMAGAMTTMISQLAFVLLIVTFLTAPFTLMDAGIFPILVALVASIAFPAAALYLQARLSRTREFAADLGAVELLGSPDELISALVKLERFASGFMFPWLRRGNSYLETHPNMVERVERLRSCRPRERTRLDFPRPFLSNQGHETRRSGYFN